MADSLFDNRYRYDYIYPRGRSGETLRAVDTQDNDRPVVIKRPAPNDAPPIRAGQEVSILNERKALTRLAGHSVATALLGGGQFFVGGTAHQYIVMERGQGVILADMVRELAQREDQRMPELETLVIVDSLLDLLQAAHNRDIVYNDVDAKHLFWDRDSYRLKVIDWGNAVFLEGDEITPQGVSRQSDIFQVGELLYSILTGGGRADIPRDASEDFLLNFGRDAERISPRLQAIISKALHPNARLRYKTVLDLRKALNEYRDPLERDRNAILGRVTERLRHNRSRDELQGLLDTLNPALATDPGNPAARGAYREILARLRDLEVSADLDAARIYLESGNWARAVDLLDELRDRARGETRAMVDLLLDFARILLNPAHGENKGKNISPSVMEAVALLFDHQNAQAAQLLVTGRNGDNRTLSWLLAERISAHTPDILLLRPNLYRMDTSLAGLATEGLVVTEPRAVLAEINTTLDTMAGSSAASLIELRDGYRAVVDGLTALGTVLETVNARTADRKLPFSSLERAMNAAMALADNMHVIGRQATASPRDALHALDSSRAIDPTSPAWDAVGRMLDGLYELLGSYQTYVPAADGSDLESWLEASRRDLLPFQERLFDEMLLGMTSGLEVAAQNWAIYGDATIQGDRIGAITALTEAIEAVSTISPTLAGWLNQVRTIVTNAAYVERHALYGGLGRALADGWEAFDRGRLTDSERLGQQALEIARTDSQRFAANRLRTLAELARGWQERTMVTNVKGTQAALVALERLYTSEENTIRENFTAQMPSKDTYLKAMGKGLVELYSRNSTAAPRLLFFNYILLGTLDAHEGTLEDAEFWRDAAVKTLGEVGSRHPLTRTLSEFTERRRDINAAAALLNSVDGPMALASLESTRKKLEDNPQARTLAAGIQSLRELENSLRDWSDGEFRSAGIKLENAIKAVGEVETAGAITLTAYRAWLMEMQAGAAELHNQFRQMQSAIESRPEKPDEIIRAAHQRMVDVTNKLLGDSHTPTLRGWRDTYESFLDVYTDNSIRRSERLNRFNQLFRAMFIDRHPAYPLYRHWYDLTEHAPEFPAPPTDEPTPRITEGEDVSENEYRGSRYAEPEEGAAPPIRVRISPRLLLLVGGGIVVLLGIAALGNALSQRSGPEIAVTITDTPTPNLTGTQSADATSSFTPLPDQTLDPANVTATLPAGDFITPTLLPTALSILPPTVEVLNVPSTTPTLTSTPEPTNTPSITPTPTNTSTSTNTPTATLPPQGLQGDQDLLGLFSQLTNFPWSSEDFSLVTAIDTSYWRLGTNEADEDDVISIAPPADLLETYYGNNAATRIRRVEAELTLTTFNPNLVTTGDVYFGMLFQDASNPAQTAGIEIELVQQGVISLSQRAGETVTALSQRSVGVYVARVRLERDPDTGNVAVFFGGEQLGQAIPFVGSDAALLPVLYVKSGGVIVSVTRWTITLR
ncbi:MAG: hypothetical protein K8L97_09260 [Anaerolineae bacterium]|nr:hypothetical protein [Anaerolineae bacterium]